MWPDSQHPGAGREGADGGPRGGRHRRRAEGPIRIPALSRGRRRGQRPSEAQPRAAWHLHNREAVGRIKEGIKGPEEGREGGGCREGTGECQPKEERREERGGTPKASVVLEEAREQGPTQSEGGGGGRAGRGDGVKAVRASVAQSCPVLCDPVD